MAALFKTVSFFLIGALLIISCASPKETILPDEPIEIVGASAHWASADLLIWNPPAGTERMELRYCQQAGIKVTDTSVSGGRALLLEPGATLTDELADKFRHIAQRQVFSVVGTTDEKKSALRGMMVAIAYNSDGNPIKATQVQIHGVLDDLYRYDGVLGPDYRNNEIHLALWAPTAQLVGLHVYDAEKNLIEKVTASGDQPENGVWRFVGPMDSDRLFYRFVVRVYHLENMKINEFEVTDPYAVSLSTDSRFSQFVNLNDPGLKPEGWDEIRKTLHHPADISLYEAHIRDFSIIDESVPEIHRGTYRAFIHNGKDGNELSVGMNHLQHLAQAGMTHLHLLPINDIRTVIEDASKRVDLHQPYRLLCDQLNQEHLAAHCETYGDTPIREVFEKWTEEDPATRLISDSYSAPNIMKSLAAYDGFNWGYDPVHFNAPEGSYATDPEGVQRILEVREMVKALYEIGLHVVVDVVYNHTTAAGIADYSVLDKVVPGYYQRLNPDTGEVETSTCCFNTAAEFYMMEKLLVDSIIIWAKQYKIDSFRFDLMGHHPRYVMENLQLALQNYTLEGHGFDGANIYIYGEGWNFGEVADNRIFDQATQFNMNGTGIGNFNDRSRDGIRGGNFTDRGRHQGFTNGQFLFPNENAHPDPAAQLASLLNSSDQIRVGMAGNLRSYPYINRYGDNVTGFNEWIGYTDLPQETVNYIDKHDNETFWDNTQTKLPLDFPIEDRVRVHILSNAIITLGQGVPFYQMGTDFLRSKSLDRNSYNSGDWYNAVDFTMETHLWGKGLPPFWDNQNRWDDMVPFLRNEKSRPAKEHMEIANQIFREHLQIRYSSPLFRLRTVEQINRRVKFHNTGQDQVPGLLVMSISDGTCAGQNLDSRYDGILMVFNAGLQDADFNTGINGLQLHEIQKNGKDDFSKESTVTRDGVVSIPGLTVAVFIKPQGSAQGIFICNP